MRVRVAAVVVLFSWVGCGSSATTPARSSASAMGSPGGPRSAVPDANRAASGTAAAPALRPAGFADRCETLMQDPEAWWPPFASVATEVRPFIAQAMRYRVTAACRGWDRDTRACFAAATDTAGERACVAAAPGPVFRDGPLDVLHEVAAFATRSGPEVTCRQAAETFYADRYWYRQPPAASGPSSITGNLGHAPRREQPDEVVTPNLPALYSPAERLALIEAARAMMAAACEAEGWSPAVRSCLDQSPHGLDQWCLTGIDGTVGPARRFTTPPLELVRTFDADCDVLIARLRSAAPTCPIDMRLESFANELLSIGRTSDQPALPRRAAFACRDELDYLVHAYPCFAAGSAP